MGKMPCNGLNKQHLASMTLGEAEPNYPTRLSTF